MSTALTILKKLESINVLKSAQDSIIETEPDMVFIQRNQLFRGERPDGNKVFPMYTPLTVFLKTQKGQPTDRVTRRDTGDYYRGIGVEVKGELFKIESTDWKAEMLNEKYGDIGLSKSSKESYVPLLKIVFIKKIKAYLA